MSSVLNEVTSSTPSPVASQSITSSRKINICLSCARPARPAFQLLQLDCQHLACLLCLRLQSAVVKIASRLHYQIPQQQQEQQQQQRRQQQQEEEQQQRQQEQQQQQHQEEDDGDSSGSSQFPVEFRSIPFDVVENNYDKEKLSKSKDEMLAINEGQEVLCADEACVGRVSKGRTLCVDEPWPERVSMDQILGVDKQRVYKNQCVDKNGPWSQRVSKNQVLEKDEPWSEDRVLRVDKDEPWSGRVSKDGFLSPLSRQFSDENRLSQRKRKCFNFHVLPGLEKGYSVSSSISTEFDESDAREETGSLSYKQPMLATSFGACSSFYVDEIDAPIICPICGLISTGISDNFNSPKLSLTYPVPPVRLCQVCDSKPKDAEYHCKKCALDLCRACFQRHDRTPLVKGHVVANVSSRDAFAFFCDQHADRTVDFMCNDCDQAFCSLCLLRVHRQHEATPITDAVAAIKDGLKSSHAVLDGLVGELEELLGRATSEENRRKISVMSVDHAVKREIPSTIPRQRHCYSVSSKPSFSGETGSRMSRQISEQAIIPLDSSYIETAGDCVRNMRALLTFSSRIFESQQPKKLLSLRKDFSVRFGYCVDTEAPRIGSILRAIINKTWHNSIANFGCSNCSDLDKKADVHCTLDQVSTSCKSSSSLDQLDHFSNHEFKSSALRPRLLWKLDRSRTGDQSELGNPMAVAFLTNPVRPQHPDLVVAEYDCSVQDNNRIRLVDFEGRTLASFSQRDLRPLGVCCSKDGRNLIVCDGRGKRVRVLSNDGLSINEMGKGQLGWPHGVVSNSHGQIIVTDVFADCVHIFSPDGKKLKCFGKSGIGKKRLRNPYHVAVDRSNNIYVSDCGNNLVKIYDSSGRFMDSCPSSTSKRTAIPADDKSNHRTNHNSVSNNHSNVSNNHNRSFVNGFASAINFRGFSQAHSDATDDDVANVGCHGDDAASVGCHGDGDALANAEGRVATDRLDAVVKLKLSRKITRLKGPRGITVSWGGDIMIADERSRVSLFDSKFSYLGTLLGEEDSLKYPEALQSFEDSLVCLTESCPGQNVATVKLYKL